MKPLGEDQKEQAAGRDTQGQVGPEHRNVCRDTQAMLSTAGTLDFPDEPIGSSSGE